MYIDNSEHLPFIFENLDNNSLVDFDIMVRDNTIGNKNLFWSSIFHYLSKQD